MVLSGGKKGINCDRTSKLSNIDVSRKNLYKAENNLVEIINQLSCDVILDHHLLRDLKYRERFPRPYEKSGSSVKTFAEYLGKENNTLEAHRKELWGK